jgi:hypothetical protein
MAAVVRYEQIILPDGTPATKIYYDNGAVEVVDGNNDRVDYQYGGATPLAGAPMAGMAPVGGAMPAPRQQKAYDYDQQQANPFTAQGVPFGSTPTYRDGSQHPLQGGQPRIPGGMYRGPAGAVDGGSGPQQVFVPGGAAAGPYDTSAAHNRPWQAEKALAGASRPWLRDSGRGSNAHPMYSAMRSKLSAKGNAMEAKVRGMASGMGSGGGGSAPSSSGYSSGSNKAYARQQHQYNQDAREQQRAYEDGSYLYDSYKMRGFSKKMDPQQAEGLMYRPSMLLPKVAKGLPSTSPRYKDVAALPAAQLSMLRYGSRGKAKDGPSQFTNNLAKFYEQAAGSGNLPSYDQLTGNLATAKRKSPLGAMFTNQPLGFGAQNYESMVTAIMGSTGLDPRMAAARTETTQGLIDQYGSRMLKKPAKKAQPINRWVAKRSDFL